jgi:hypothetical protein
MTGNACISRVEFPLRAWPKARAAGLVLCLSALGAATPDKPQRPQPGITFELGSSVEYVRVTPEYSNAVLQAVLPYVSEIARKLDMPVPYPVTADQVAYCSVLPNRRVEAEIGIKSGWTFAFGRGYVQTVQSIHSYSILQDPDQIPQYFAPLRMSAAEAVESARSILRRLNISIESVFADLEPQVGGPHHIGTNIVPHYDISWPSPIGAPSVQVEINGNTKRFERICLRNIALERPLPKLAVFPPRDDRFPVWPEVSLAYASRLLPIVLTAVQEYAQKLALPLPKPLTTNHVARFSVADNGGWPHSELELTNGWRFIYRNSMVNGFYAPDNLFKNDDKPIRVKAFLGQWRFTELEARALVRRTLAKLNYPTKLVHFEVEPQVIKPALPGIPRYMFYWYYNRDDDLQSTIWAEVDADKKELKSLYFDDKSYWNHPPPIDVPISLPLAPTTNQTPLGAPGRVPFDRPPSRPQSSFNPPVPR